MTIAEVREKCKSAFAQFPRDVLIIGVLVFASTASFCLGYLAGEDAGKGSGDENAIAVSAPPEATNTAIVASKFGAKYYLTSCSGASRISAANKVYFSSAAAARAAGYSPAGNCAGL
ncbi:hypothetical protein KGM48_02305 [Patescibacteria group bacterium]|nr:hypothetical protein [Patescibacteria group bacterium]